MKTTFSPILQRFIQKSPVCVMARAAIERIIDATLLNELFERHAHRQYTRDLTFAHVVELLCDVVYGIAPSVHASYQKRAHDLSVSAAALYQKINRIEPGIAQALLRHSYQQVAEVRRCLRSDRQPWVAGYRVKIVDGNHFCSTEHRLKELRTESAAPLPGKAVVVLDAETMSISDVYLEEDGHAQESSHIPALLEQVSAGELYLADRFYSIHRTFFGLAERGAAFVIRQHGRYTPQAVTEPVLVGRTDDATVYEQTVRLCWQQQQMLVRRISVELDEPTRKGDRQIHLLSNLPVEDATAIEISQLYRKRWRIEDAFFELTTTLCCEITTLCYPRAALLTFTLALVSYNIVSLINAAMQAVHGSEEIEQGVSAYYLTLEIRQTYEGMLIAVDAEEWQELARVSAEEFAEALSKMARAMSLGRYRKHKRGPKKAPPKRTSYLNGAHVSTAAILAKRSPP
jgi:hypothetical protein